MRTSVRVRLLRLCSQSGSLCSHSGSACAGGLQLAYSVAALLVFQGLSQSFWTLVAWQVGTTDHATNWSYICSSATRLLHDRMT